MKRESVSTEHLRIDGNQLQAIENPFLLITEEILSYYVNKMLTDVSANGHN